MKSGKWLIVMLMLLVMPLMADDQTKQNVETEASAPSLRQAIVDRFGRPDRIVGDENSLLCYGLKNGDTLTFVIAGDRVLGVTQNRKTDLKKVVGEKVTLGGVYNGLAKGNDQVVTADGQWFWLQGKNDISKHGQLVSVTGVLEYFPGTHGPANAPWIPAHYYMKSGSWELTALYPLKFVDRQDAEPSPANMPRNRNPAGRPPEAIVGVSKKIESILPTGWSLKQEKTIVTIKRDKPIEWYCTISLPNHKDLADLKAKGFIKSGTYTITLEFFPPMSQAAVDKLVEANRQIEERYYEKHPQPKNIKPSVPWELQQSLHHIPDILTERYSVLVTPFIHGYRLAFFNEDDKKECEGVEQDVRRLLKADETEQPQKYDKSSSQPLPPEIMLPDAPKTVRDIETFRSLCKAMTMVGVVRKCGLPDEHQGSGIFIFVYHLRDGSTVMIGTADLKSLLYARHADKSGKATSLISEMTAQ